MNNRHFEGVNTIYDVRVPAKTNVRVTFDLTETMAAEAWGRANTAIIIWCIVLLIGSHDLLRSLFVHRLIGSIDQPINLLSLYVVRGSYAMLYPLCLYNTLGSGTLVVGTLR